MTEINKLDDSYEEKHHMTSAKRTNGIDNNNSRR